MVSFSLLAALVFLALIIAVATYKYVKPIRSWLVFGGIFLLLLVLYATVGSAIILADKPWLELTLQTIFGSFLVGLRKPYPG